MAYYIAEGAVVKGQVTMADGASVWYNATVRGDSEPIEIGRNSNIQDNAVVHVDLSHSVRIGDNVTIGHSAIVHGGSLAFGSPAKVIRALTADEIEENHRNAMHYVEIARESLI